ncbi:dynamin family protein [Aliibacillus thermotolerans]|uniref:Dynamin family protein n=1 Tax=Aliibacillus thermotolerans TaxID=1834418 RepID=A0ABW0U469_9BACI|nr:dynamin family protein [Aliibacillus thermotolerans]MDA3130158.1 GTP-binding protein [Aliibacillus thermotolerans]
MNDVQVIDHDLATLPFQREDEERLQKLARKKEDPFFEIAFCGHFSAGKSTLLNRLLGNELLPTSPIPTSANVISIQNGDVKLEVERHDGEVEVWHEEIPWAEAKRWGMDGESISSIRIYAPLPFLSKRAKILDTPGVDSTDVRHQQVTAQQLMTTDFIVYVTDYNHVQSETNIHFLKQLSNENKPILLVINQIDKHDENELSLQVFENNVRNMLVQFGIQPIHVFFTSMKVEDHPFNQYEQLEKFIKGMTYSSSSLIEDSLKQLERGTVLHLLERLKEEKEEAFDDWKQSVTEKGLDPHLFMERQKRQERLADMNDEKRKAIQSLYQERDHLFQNAQLFPYTTTEKARQWLESQQPSFKVGFLFSGKKTKEERQRRERALLEELNEKIKTQLLFHVRNMLLKVDEVLLEEKETYQKEVQTIEFTADASLLTRFVTSATEMDRKFVYTFTKNVTNEIVKEVKHKTDHLFHEYERAIEKRFHLLKEELEEKERAVSHVQEEWERWEETEASYDRSIEKCKIWLEQHEKDQHFFDTLKRAAEKPYPEDAIHPIAVIQEEESVISEKEDIVLNERDAVNVDDSFLQPLYEYLKTFAARDIFQEEKKRLLQLLTQYENNTAVISLFGAFSAGKSSFINAMLGDTVLPVSPHPTTAAVNRIRKSTEDYPHGTVVIQMKDENFLQDEIQAASRELGLSLDFDSISQWKKPATQGLNGYQRMYADYLHTLKEGMKREQRRLGEQVQIDLKELDEWVAKEERACMIQEVIVYYDSEWTEKGLELVDTPGVNSIHGRHTNVAFEQLRQSDAIFYLTYYNHAFSKADEMFLQQLGRANEHFETNKLYFIINAADLASNRYELHGVKAHVKEQLEKNGIQTPRLFALSSKEGLKRKRSLSHHEETGKAFEQFEQFFTETTWKELQHLHLQKMKREWTTIFEQLSMVLRSMSKDQKALEKHLQEKNDAAERLKKKVSQFHVQFLFSLLMEEIEQQSSYLKERTSFHVQDYFHHVINPTIFTATSKKQQKNQLQGALQELEGFLRQYVSQEIETMFIRLETKAQKAVSQYVEEFFEQQKPPQLYLIPPTLDIAIQHPLKKDNRLSLHQEHLLSYFKSTKDFFENQQVNEMKEALRENIHSVMHPFMQEFEKEMEEELKEIVQTLTVKGREEIIAEIEKEMERSTWLYDLDRKPEIEEEVRFIEASLQA